MATLVDWFNHKKEINSRLLTEDGEQVVDEVHKHWVNYVLPIVEVVAALLFWLIALFTNVQTAWAPMLVGLALLGDAARRAVVARRDMFVVTTIRVFRIRGVFTTKVGSMPLMRILDIALEQPFFGHVVGYPPFSWLGSVKYGHLVFESAAQEQGMREIKYVPRPRETERRIQQVIQRSGLRARADMDKYDGA
jgi:hypothetical protein